MDRYRPKISEVFALIPKICPARLANSLPPGSPAAETLEVSTRI